jgi:hypothetical protein
VGLLDWPAPPFAWLDGLWCSAFAPCAGSALQKRQWWNSLIGNPIGYLPESSPLEWIDLDLPEKEYLPFGPTWLRASYVRLLACCSPTPSSIKDAAVEGLTGKHSTRAGSAARDSSR